MSIFQQKSCSINFWGAVADGMPENLKAEACYEVAMGDVELDEGPMGIIMPYLHKEDHENRSSSCRPGELGCRNPRVPHCHPPPSTYTLQYKLPSPRTSWTRWCRGRPHS